MVDDDADPSHNAQISDGSGAEGSHDREGLA
jgi:hypothetical protein